MQKILAFLVLASLSGLAAAGTLTNPAITLSSDVRGAGTAATIAFTTATTEYFKYFIVSNTNFDTSVHPTSVTCGNLTASVVGWNLANLLQVNVTTGSYVSASITITCAVQGLQNAAAPASQITNIGIATYANTSFPIDNVGSGTAPAIVAGALTVASVIPSNFIKNSTGVSATIAFRVSSNPGLIQRVTLSATNFDHAVAPTLAVSCTGLSAGNATWSGSVLVLQVTTPASVAASSAVTCTVAGLKNTENAAASTTCTISTLTAAATVLDSVASVLIPPVFNAALGNPSIALSSNVKATNVSVTITFTTTTAGSIKRITVAGVNFDTAVSPTSAYSCTGLSAGTVSLSTTNLVLIVDSAASVNASTVVTCTVSGLKNAAAAAAASTVVIATSDNGNANLDGAVVAFPAILDSNTGGGGGSAPSNTKSSASVYEFSVLLIALLFLFA